ncbi:MAG: PAS domain S-box protein [Holophagaceae bacterium]|uniref:histidine kinase n=1 Tax=Candidatus Geothrix skivensis TaxID=2954439 RepID=A0A9D7XIH6_9BACT|nr:PAS domain S-box protein [Candidatus Geothrix skivensis]
MMLTTLRKLFLGTLRRRLIFSVAALQAVLMLLFIADLARRHRALITQRQSEQVASSVNTLAGASSGLMASNDIAGLQELVEAQRLTPGLRFAMYLDEDGHILAHTDPLRVGQYLRDLPPLAQKALVFQKGTVLEGFAPIMIANHHLGWSYLGIDQTEAQGALAGITREGVLYSLVAILVGSLLAWLLGSRVVRRLAVLQSAMHEVQEGQVAVRSPLTGTDEVAALSVDFNRMLDRLDQGESDLKKSEEQFRSLAEYSTDVIFTLDVQSTFLFVSPAWERHFGYPVSGVLGQPFRQFVHPEDVQPCLDLLTRVLTNGQSATSPPFRVRHADGSWRWFMANGSRMSTSEGGFQFMGVGHDITEHLHLERTSRFLAQAEWLTTGEDFFAALGRFLAHHLAMDYVCIDRLLGEGLAAKTLAIWFDGHAEDNVEYTLKDTPCGEVVGRTICCFPDGVRHQFPQDQVLQDMGAESYLGTTLWGSGGQPIGLIALIGRHPITTPRLMEATLALVSVRAAGELERRDAEAKLNESLAFTHELIGSMQDGFSVVDRTGLQVDVNPSFCRMTGFSREELVGVGAPYPYWPPEEQETIQAALLETIKGITTTFELTFMRKNGERFPVLVSPAAIKDALGRSILFSATVKDITERKRAEQYEHFRSHTLELLAAKEPLAALLKAIVLGVEQLRPELLCSVLLLDSEGRHLEKGVAPSLPDFYNAALDGIEIGVGVGSCGTAAFTGKQVIVSDIATHPYWAPYKELAAHAGLAACWSQPIRDARGQVLGTFAIYHRAPHTPTQADVDLIEQTANLTSIAIEQRQAEEALRESEERWKFAIEGAGDGLWDWNVQTGKAYFSPRYKAMYGYAEADIGTTSDEWSKRIHPDDAPGVWATLQPYMEGKPGPATIEFRMLCKDGGWRWTLGRGMVVGRDTDGKPTRMIGTNTDITEQRNLKDALVAHSTALSAVIDNNPMSIQILDSEGRTILTNPAFLRLFGAIPPPTYCMFSDPTLAKQGLSPVFDQIQAGEVVYFPEASYNVHDLFPEFPDSPVWVRALGFPIIGTDGRPERFVLMHEDVSQRRNAEQVRAELQAQLQQSQKMESLGTLAGGVAHDMNNVLGAILGLASAHIGTEPYGSPLHQALDTICKATERGGKMVKSLLSFARQTPAENKMLDMNAILREQVSLLERTTLATVRFQIDLDADLRPIRGDAGALTHAFMNLCVNAMDAMPENGTLTLRTRNVDNDWIEVVVEDNGLGMPKEVLEKATEPFFTTKGTGKGTGLGLSLVFSTVKAHRGQMAIESEPGQGTRVWLRFPACEQEVPVQAAAQAEAEDTVVPHGSLKVLLVDDDDLIQSSVQAILECLGYTAVSTAQSGEEALALIEAGLEPDLVILDMNMPGLGGTGTLPRLRRLRPAVPVLLSTGRTDQTALTLASAHPGVTLLAKPFGLRELQKHLESIGLG